MDRYEDIQELLDDVAGNRRELEQAYEAARTDEAIKTVLRPLVKSSLEHLRSSLEFCAQDVRAAFCRPPKERDRFYFPFGESESRFEESIRKNLLGLDASHSAYLLIKSLQPFACGDRWLVSLCEQTNFNKHDRLSTQTRVDSDSKTVRIGGNAFVFGGGAVVELSNCTIRGVAVGTDKPVRLDCKRPIGELRAALPAALAIDQIYDWVEFRFASSAEDTLALIGNSHDRIAAFVDELKGQLP